MLKIILESCHFIFVINYFLLISFCTFAEEVISEATQLLKYAM